MSKQLFLLIFCASFTCTAGFLSADDKSEKPRTKETTPANKKGLVTAKDKASYGIGMNIGRDIKRNLTQGGVELNMEALIAGFISAVKGEKPDVSQEELQKAFVTFREEMQAKKDKADKAKADVSQKYLADNAKKKGVTVTKSGLQYEVIKSGKGASPGLDDKVTTHYTGTLIDGTVFDSSVKRGMPATFPVSGVIKGWTEALQLMKVGDKWKLTIPSELAYGKQGRPSIPANSVLVFDIELLAIEGAKK